MDKCSRGETPREVCYPPSTGSRLEVAGIVRILPPPAPGEPELAFSPRSHEVPKPLRQIIPTPTHNVDVEGLPASMLGSQRAGSTSNNVSELLNKRTP